MGMAFLRMAGSLLLFALMFANQCAGHEGHGHGPVALPTESQRNEFDGKLGKNEDEIFPLAVATAVGIDSETWADIQISSPPARYLSGLLSRGYYRLEIFQLIVIAAGGGRSLPSIVEKRDKGTVLREIARDLQMDFDRAYDVAVEIDQFIERIFLPTILTVSASPRVPAESGESQHREINVKLRLAEYRNPEPR